MFTWNNPYVLAVLLGLVAALFTYLEQKQKNEEPTISASGKSFALVTGLVLVFHHVSANPIECVTQAAGALSGAGTFSNLKIQGGHPDF